MALDSREACLPWPLVTPSGLPCAPTGLTEPVLIRLDVDAKLNEQLKVRPSRPLPQARGRT